MRRPFVPYTDNTGNCATTYLAVTASQSAVIDLPNDAPQLRIDFSGSELILRFVQRGSAAPAIDQTKSITWHLSAIEILTIPVLGTSVASLVVSGSGVVRFTPGTGE